MKRTLLLLIALAAISFLAKAQSDTTRKTHSWVFTEKSVIKDSAGTRVPYDTWKKMLMTRKYLIRPVDPSNDSTEFLILDRATHSNEFVVRRNSSETQVLDKVTRAAEMPRPPESIFFKTGEKIPSFNANDIEGKKIKLKDLEGKIVVLNFWFIGCPPCRYELPELNKLALEYANNPDVVFVSIGLDDKYDIRQFIKGNPFAYHVIGNGTMYASLYRINLYPTNVVLDKEGKVRFHSSGYPQTTPYWIKKTIEELSKPSNNSTGQ